MGVWLNLATIDDVSDTTAYSFGSSTPPTSGDIVAIGINAEAQQNLPTVTGTNGWNGLTWSSRVTQSSAGDRVRIMTATSAGGAAGVVTLTWGSALTGCAASLDTHPDITSEVPVQTAKVGSTGTAAPLTMSAFGDAANEGYYVAAITGSQAVTIGGGYSGFHSWQRSNFSGVVGGATNDPTPTATWGSSSTYNAAAVEFTAVTGGIPDFAEATGTDDVSAFMTWTAAPTQAQIHRSQEDGFAPTEATLLATIDGADTAYEDTTAGHDNLWRYLITTTAPVALSAQLDIRMAPPRPIDLTLDSKTQRDAVVSVTRVSSSTRNQHNWYWRVKGNSEWIIQHSEDSDNIEGRTNLYDGPAFTAGTTYEFTATSTSTTYGKESGFATLLEVTLESNVIQTGSLVIIGYAPNVIATNQTTQLRVSGFHI